MNWPKLNLTNEDCMDLLARTPDKFYELAIVDPEYGIGASAPSVKPNKVKQKNGAIISVKNTNYTKKDWDNKTPEEAYFDEVIRTSKRQIIWGANYFGLKGGMIVWDKLNGGSDQYDAEIGYMSWTQEVRTVYYMWSGMFQGEKCSANIYEALKQQGNKKLNEKRIHPTQKPVALYKWLLTNYAKPNDKILDTHLGSGSIAIACLDMGFELTGCELDKEYFSKMQERINAFMAQPKLISNTPREQAKQIQI